MSTVAGLLMIATTLASFTSLVLRFRRSHGTERQQLKWVTAAAVLFLVTFLQPFTGTGNLSFTILLFGLLIVASGVAVAMLRYRLYDIDVVINRALVYGSLTAMLAGVYLGSVLLLQVVLETITGGSGLAVAASTLGTAALFGPCEPAPRPSLTAGSSGTSTTPPRHSSGSAPACATRSSSTR